MTKKKQATRLQLKKRSVRKLGDRQLDEAKGGCLFPTGNCEVTEDSCATSIRRQTGANSSPPVAI
jgi:hypothetical protein